MRIAPDGVDQRQGLAFQVGQVIIPLSTGIYASGGEFGQVQALRAKPRHQAYG
jgi:hypothetical protein